MKMFRFTLNPSNPDYVHKLVFAVADNIDEARANVRQHLKENHLQAHAQYRIEEIGYLEPEGPGLTYVIRC